MMGGGKEDDWSNVTRKAKSVRGVLNFGHREPKVCQILDPESQKCERGGNK